MINFYVDPDFDVLSEKLAAQIGGHNFVSRLSATFRLISLKTQQLTSS